MVIQGRVLCTEYPRKAQAGRECTKAFIKAKTSLGRFRERRLAVYYKYSCNKNRQICTHLKSTAIPLQISENNFTSICTFVYTSIFHMQTLHLVQYIQFK